MKQKTLKQWVTCTLAIYGAACIAWNVYFKVGSELLCLEDVAYLPFLYLTPEDQAICTDRIFAIKEAKKRIAGIDPLAEDVAIK